MESAMPEGPSIVILRESIFAGVGNISRNEVLFRITPQLFLHQLPEAISGSGGA